MPKKALCVPILLVVVPGAALAAQLPVAVSPGTSAGALTGDACPTFSWSSVARAEGYELVVYRFEEEREEPVLRQRFMGSVDGWTPPLDRCLDRGGRYAWSVRALGEGASPEWSRPSYFQVAAGPSRSEFEEALAVVRRYLQPDDEEGESAKAPPAEGAARALVADAARLPEAAGESDLQVNGSPVLTVASLAPFLAAATRCPDAVGSRYADRGDGTVVDCDTGLIWLRDADCFGLLNWLDALAAAAALAHGACGLTDGSLAGQWRLATIGELCSRDAAGPIGGVCPVGAAPDSLVNTNFSDPTVSDAAGTGPWTSGDPFVDVRSGDYWSGTQTNSGFAWNAYLFTGFINDLSTTNTAYVWPVRSGP